MEQKKAGRRKRHCRHGRWNTVSSRIGRQRFTEKVIQTTDGERRLAVVTSGGRVFRTDDTANSKFLTCDHALGS